jgi:hypothetical protein
MSRPYVTKVTFTGGEIVLTVLLDNFLANTPVEISGSATQNSGGFALFNDTQSVGANPDGTVIMYVKATPSVEFTEGDDVTVFLRAASVWVTVLGEEQVEQTSSISASVSRQEGTLAQDGATWGNPKEVGYPKV